MVYLLLDSGADINEPGKYGTIALTQASDSGRMDLARVLVDHGAALNPEHMVWGKYLAIEQMQQVAKKQQWLAVKAMKKPKPHGPS